MCLKEMGPRLAGWRIEIVATYLSRDASEKSRAVLYRQYEVQHTIALPAMRRRLGHRPSRRRRDLLQWRDSDMTEENRATERVTFSRGYDVCIMAIDGTWRRDCVLKGISDNDATLTVEGSIQGLNL